ncbi:hypothetical protein [Rugamonas apoptosis]|uniref:Uncharacterized protein n=1 Tax=Rugamonas apoptosis TaxID=2758570 RepID=A0A7W2F7F2_9BURK|nr:hypothetical protein [Rugamonas apoptosis]MBA5686533.1 hypothetical protein [Rugamonas apoptosis]
MSKTPLSLLLLLPALAGAAQLTELETRWLTAGLPALNYARQELGLPLDITVQPQAGPNDVPLALGFEDGRCKLVLSMRGNPAAESVLDGVPEAQRAILIEAMTAHEIGHCWRYVHHQWHMLPAGFVEAGQQRASSADLLEQARIQRATQREEGYADLLALSWTARRHPAQYTQVYRWMRQVRQPAAGGSHDTTAWLQLAADRAVFSSSSPLFEQVSMLWSKGLFSSD